jgi:hypothetical protein
MRGISAGKMGIRCRPPLSSAHLRSAGDVGEVMTTSQGKAFGDRIDSRVDAGRFLANAAPELITARAYSPFDINLVKNS